MCRTVGSRQVMLAMHDVLFLKSKTFIAPPSKRLRKITTKSNEEKCYVATVMMKRGRHVLLRHCNRRKQIEGHWEGLTALLAWGGRLWLEGCCSRKGEKAQKDASRMHIHKSEKYAITQNRPPFAFLFQIKLEKHAHGNSL